MNDETIVAVYDSEAHAESAVRDLRDAGLPPSAVDRHEKGRGSVAPGAVAPAPPQARERGFWGNLFGGEPDQDHDTAVYDRSVDSGSVVVTVRVERDRVNAVIDILERHRPIDIDERAASYGLSPAIGNAVPTRRAGIAGTTTGDADRGTGAPTLQLAEETLDAGTRAINRGNTRVRRYVVETPAEQQATLRDETVPTEPPARETRRAATAPGGTEI